LYPPFPTFDGYKLYPLAATMMIHVRTRTILATLFLGTAPVAHSAEISETLALRDCYNREFGYMWGLPAEELHNSMKYIYGPPEAEDPAVREMLLGAFEGNTRALDAAFERKGTLATLAVDRKGNLAGNDSSTESAESQHRRYVVPPELTRRFAMSPNVKLGPNEPRRAQFTNTFGLPPASRSALMWAVIGARRQWCLQERTGTPQDRRQAIRSLIARGANPAFEDLEGRSPIALAISALVPSSPSKAGREELARLLISSLPKLKDQDSTLTRWLVLASARGSESIAALLIAKGAKVSDDEALWYARIRGNKEVDKLLVARGAVLDLSDRPQFRERLLWHFNMGDMQAVEFALANGAEPVLAAVVKDRATQFIGTNSIASPVVLRMLVKAGAKCRVGLSALFRNEGIAPARLFESAEILLTDLRCDPNEGVKEGPTPLMLVDDSNVELIRLLVKHGATTTPHPHTEDSYLDSLYWAVTNKRPNLAGAVMEFNKPSADQVAMCLAYAVRYGSPQLVSSMLAHGANPSFGRDADDFTPLMFAVERRNLEMAHMLIEAGADLNAQTKEAEPGRRWSIHGSWRSRTGRLTALMMAAGAGNESMVVLLLKSGADKRIWAQGWVTAEDFARDYSPKLADLIARYPN
jgi:ankyrin repeat protein